MNERRIAFRVRLSVPVLGVVERSGVVVEGPAGWGELSPLPSWSAAERAAAMRCCDEARTQPQAVAAGAVTVNVNAMIPRVDPDLAAELALASNCQTIKVKVGDAGGDDRVAAVRAAVGRGVRIRVDANGAWDVDTAITALQAMRGRDVELVEDPVASLEELAEVRRHSPVPVAAEMSVRTVEDAARLARLEAADAVVLKPQRIGGLRASLDAAEAARVPAIASSALETSVGLATVLRVAAALPATPFAHGVGTALLLAEDVTSLPLLPMNGTLVPRAVTPDLLLGADAGD